MRLIKNHFKVTIRLFLIMITIITASLEIGHCQFIQIKSILVDACNSNDSQNEMVYFSVGSSAINVADIRVDGSMNGGAYQPNKWPNTSNSFLGWITPGSPAYTNAASKIVQINTTLTNCGKLIIPTGGTNNQGILPAGSRGMIITSTDFATFANSFATLNDTLYILFQNPGNTNEHFVNYSIGTGIRSLRLTQVSSGQTESVTYDKAMLISQTGSSIAQDGAGVRFTDAGLASYFNNGCVAPFRILYTTWNSPPAICQLSPGINLDLLLSDTSITGGTWSGSGVTGNMFNPNGLSGNIPITYSYGTSSCAIAVTHPINVIPIPIASWIAPPPICQSVNATLLPTLLAPGATQGGTWSGPGVTGSTLNTYTISGNITLTYTVGTAPCIATESHILTIIGTTWAIWASPISVCESAGPINLNSLLASYSTRGGIWNGQGVTDSIFNPAGLSGDINVTYSVGIAPCISTESHIISVVGDSSSSWSFPTDSLCDSAPIMELDSLLSDLAITNGIWTGPGITDRVFRPENLVGTTTLTYTVGSGICTSTESHSLTIVPSSCASWNPPAVPICQHQDPVSLNNLLSDTSTLGGTWTGIGVTGNNFFPTGLNGTYTITYSVGHSPCIATESHTLTVIPTANPSWTAPAPICENASPLNLNTLLGSSATPGGDWSGNGVAGNLFYPSGLSGNIPITYTVGDILCLVSQTHNMYVISTANPAWTNPGGICQSSPPLDLNTLFTDSTTQGGTWSGQGVSGNMLDASELSGSIIVTYTVGDTPCIAEESHAIQVSTSVDGTWLPISPVCSNTPPIDLSATITGNPGGTWSGNGISGSIFNPTSLSGPIKITYTVQNAYCNDSVPLFINVIPSPIASINNPPTICISSNIFDLNTILTGTTGGTWSGAAISSNIINIDSTGNPITVSYIVGNSYCADSLTALLNFGTVVANFVLSPSTGFAPLDVTTTNVSTNATTYFWSFGNGLTSSDFEPSPRFLYEGAYQVWLKAISADGCIDSTYREVTTVSAGDFIPNSFSPNNDGVNDTFLPVITKYTDDYQLIIFDRWGKTIFETKDQTKSWDGTLNNNIVPVGVYIYVINFKSGKNVYYYNGTITLIK